MIGPEESGALGVERTSEIRGSLIHTGALQVVWIKLAKTQQPVTTAALLFLGTLLISDFDFHSHFGHAAPLGPARPGAEEGSILQPGKRNVWRERFPPVHQGRKLVAALLPQRRLKVLRGRPARMLDDQNAKAIGK